MPWGGGSPSATRGAQCYPLPPKAISDLTTCALQRGHFPPSPPGELHLVFLPQVGLCWALFVSPGGGSRLKNVGTREDAGTWPCDAGMGRGLGPCHATITRQVLPKLSESANKRCSLPGLAAQWDPRRPHGFGEGHIDQCTFAFCTLPPPLVRGRVLGAGGPRCAPAQLLRKRFCFP